MKEGVDWFQMDGLSSLSLQERMEAVSEMDMPLTTTNIRSTVQLAEPRSHDVSMRIFTTHQTPQHTIPHNTTTLNDSVAVCSGGFTASFCRYSVLFCFALRGRSRVLVASRCPGLQTWRHPSVIEEADPTLGVPRSRGSQGTPQRRRVHP